MADTLPPTLVVDRPADGAVQWGRFRARVSATDQWGVADVVMSIDGVPHATDKRAPYRFAVDTAGFSAGPHELSFVATDHAGNSSTAKRITVTFQPPSTSAGNAGRIEFLSPAFGAAVSGDVNIQATVSDSDSLATIEWLIDGETVLVSSLTGRSSGVSFLWDAAGVAPGRHTITVIITDSYGDRSTARLDLVTS